MSEVFHYWRWIRITAQGKRQVEEIPEARAFMQQQFPDLFTGATVSDAEIQRQLIRLMRATPESPDPELAECCLRCFISYRIDWICRDLAIKFGEKGQFTALELLPFVLNEVEVLKSKRSRAQTSHYQSLASKILHTFDPERSQLSTWTKRLVISNADLTAFLAECGIRLLSSWSVLNSATPQWLQRRLTLSSAGLTQAISLLDSYNQVYKRDRLTGPRGPCPPPTLAQLTEMAAILKTQSGYVYQPEEVLEALHQLADRIREAQYPKTESIDDDQHRIWADQQTAPDPEEEDEHHEFLTTYRDLFMAAMKQGIEQTVEHRFTHLSRKDTSKAQQFMEALFWFHCLTLSMTTIGQRLQLKQFQVTRLLELLKLREDAKRNAWMILREQVKDLAAQYRSIDQLEQLMQEIDAALEAQIEQLIEEERKRASTGHRTSDGLAPSRFSMLLCEYLDHCSYFTPGD